MITRRILIENIPAIIWGKPSDRVFLCVHGKMSSKEAAAQLAQIAEEKGCQTISFDLPQHGERQENNERCDVWNGVRDLNLVGDYVFSRWKEVSLFACSLGAFFSLHAYAGRRFKTCLFQSPILDMDYLIRQMMVWFDISEERLEREREIDTPIDLMTWDYVQYVRAHPVDSWHTPAHILFAGRDNLQTQAIIDGFVRRFGGSVTLSKESNHPFMDERDAEIVERWLRDNL